VKTQSNEAKEAGMYDDIMMSLILGEGRAQRRASAGPRLGSRSHAGADYPGVPTWTVDLIEAEAMRAHIAALNDAPSIVRDDRAADQAGAATPNQHTTGGHTMVKKRDMKGWLRALLLAATGALFGSIPPAAADGGIAFDLVRSAGAEANNCLLDAEGSVTVGPHESADVMKVTVKGLPPNTTFDVFVIQLPSAPFGLSWYQGDVKTNSNGVGHAAFRGRFNIETFIVAPGSGPAPVVFTDAIPDASTNPATGPVHTYHVGLWFDSTDAAVAAGCPATVTPFNGEHNAGIQALSTKQFPNDEGPLRQLQ
jgi:hypothetical protein